MLVLVRQQLQRDVALQLRVPRAHDDEGAYVLGALSGFGIMSSQAAADLLSAHLLGRPLPNYAAAFHPARFADPSYLRVLATIDPKSGQL